jgi:uncharacterized GH25 family protein
MTRRALPALALLLLPPAAAAHDYWLQPEVFFPAVGAPVAVRLHVGEGLVSEAERPFQKKATLGFRLLSARAPVDLAAGAREGDKPVARVTFPAAGTYLLAMERAPQSIEMEAKKFNDYLAEEGLDAILAQRRKLGEDKLPGRERYRRYLKVLVQAGGRGDDTWKRAAGQRLEIVPLADPLAAKPGAALPLRVLFDGKPLAGVKVFAHRRAGGKTVTQAGLTSAKGEVTFKLDGAGVWLVRLVHMRRAADKDADWESFWGALTFAVR